MSSLEPKKLSFDFYDLESLSENPKCAEYEKEQDAMRKQTAFNAYKKSGVPSKFFETTLGTYSATTDEEVKNKSVVVDFAGAPSNRVLILCGRNGTGKTSLGCGVIRQYGGVYTTSSDLCIEYEAATSYHAERTRNEILKYYARAKMLVLDECGKYTLNQNIEQFLLAYLISARYENNLATVLITNSNKKEFVEFLGKSVFDRLTEVCTTLEFTGESKRKQMRAGGKVL